MSEKTESGPVEAGSAVRELRALLTSYEQALSGNPNSAARPRTRGRAAEDPLMLINGIPIDLRASALLAYRPIRAPEIVDCCRTERADPFTFVHELTSGVFRIHPRRGKLSAGLIGPFSGPPPAGVLATAQTTHASAPPVRFHLSLWTGDWNPGAVREHLDETSRTLPFALVEPGRQGLLIATATPAPPQGADPESSSRWGILLATMAEPPEKFEFAWADFSTIVLMFSSPEGADTAILI